MNEPLISIIIPTYNRAHLISEALDSVLMQTYTNWECIIVDDGSTDSTEVIVNHYLSIDSRFQYHKRPINYKSGANGARNYGAKLSNSRFLIFLDSDDLLIDNALKNRIKYIINSKTHFDLLISNTAIFKSKIGDSIALWNIYNKSDTNLDLLRKFLNVDMPWHTNGVTWSKEFFNKIGGWNEELKAWQDWELHTRALLNSPIVIGGEDCPDNFYKIQGSNSIKDNDRTIKYYKSVSSAICIILKSLKNSSSIKNEVIHESNKLAIRFLIKMPITHRFYLESIMNFGKINILCDFRKFEIVKFYFLEFTARSTKLKLFLIKKLYDRYQEYINVPRTFMKLTIHDIKK